MRAEPSTGGARRTRSDELDALQAELKGKTAEAEWLRAHYDEQLRAAFAQVAALQSRLREASAAQPAVVSVSAAPDMAELERLRREVERLSAAEARYLDRIEELKELNARDQSRSG